ncbi:MAG: MarR family transcriptional regulator [Acidimicrobiales bacterium]
MVLVTRKASHIPDSSRVFEVIASLRALGAELDHLDEAAARHYRLNRTDMRALDIVGREGPIAPTDLARRLGFTTGGITTVIDRLERAGYVVRRPSATDRRRLVVEVSDSTREKDIAVFGGLFEKTQALVATYHDDEELALIRRFMDDVRTVTEEYANWLTTEDVEE